MESENIEKFSRRPATKVTIKDISKGKYVQENEQSANYILTKGGKKLFRVSITAAVLHKELQGSITNILIDDGSEKIILRSFEENKTIKELTIGDVILVVGRIRIYNTEKYISPEIVKKIDPLWLKVRSLELNSFENKEYPNQENEKYVESKNDNIVDAEKTEDTGEIKEVEDDLVMPLQKLRKLISELDQGNGVLIEEVIEKSSLDKTEELIQKMLENGDIFQNVPGKIKVL